MIDRDSNLGGMPVLVRQATDFPGWYQDYREGATAETGPVRGTMVIRPWGYAIWEHIQAEMDRRIKAAGAENVYFPLLIPEGHLRREAEHVDGFSPELAVVTKAGGRDLQEPAIIRPTSETVFGEYLARWIKSYRDLPAAPEPVGQRRALGAAPAPVSAHERVPVAGRPHRPHDQRTRPPPTRDGSTPTSTARSSKTSSRSRC